MARRRPIALDLFAGAGGSAMGLWQAGYLPVGIDKSRQALRRYPFPHLTPTDLIHVEPDQLLHEVAKLLVRLGLVTTTKAAIRRIKLFSGSPPCQLYSYLTGNHPNTADNAHQRPNLIPLTRYLFQNMQDFLPRDVPYLIENVEGARSRLDHEHTVQLCGSSHPFVCGFRGIACSSITQTSRSSARSATMTGNKLSPCTSRTAEARRAGPRASFRCMGPTPTACGTKGPPTKWTSQVLISRGWPWESTGCQAGIWRRPSRRLSPTTSVVSF